MTLEQLLNKAPFESWQGFVTQEQYDASTSIYQTTLQKLIAIGPGKPAPAYLPTLNGYIESFNRLDAREEFIMTEEREEICERLAEILEVLALPGIRECDDLETARDW